MERILVLGCGGAGKSTFSRELGKITGIPVYHLDTFYWKPGWKASTEAEFDNTIEELLEKDQWIIDGNFIRTLVIRIKEADTVIFFDMPRYICIYRIVKRRFMFQGKSRPDITEGCKENLNFEFINWIWSFNKKVRPRILETLKQHSNEKNVITFSSRVQVKKYLKQRK